MIMFRRRVRGGVTYQEVKRAYIEVFKIPRWRVLLSNIETLLRVGGIFRFADATYRQVTDADEQRLVVFLKQDQTDLQRYTHPDFDCDDFAFRLHGALHYDRDFAAMPIFITWVSWFDDGLSYAHAVESYYKDGKINIIEPQTDEVFGVPGHWKLNMVCG